MSLSSIFLRSRTAANIAIRHRSPNVTTRMTNIAKRSMGSGGGDMPEPQSMKAELFGGHVKESGWEPVMNVTYAATAVLLYFVWSAPDTSIKTWAAGEAQRRLDLQEKGELEEVEYGVFYDTSAKYNFDSKTLDDPFDEGDEDDDDDDDDEDEEEEEDDDDDDE